MRGFLLITIIGESFLQDMRKDFAVWEVHITNEELDLVGSSKLTVFG